MKTKKELPTKELITSDLKAYFDNGDVLALRNIYNAARRLEISEGVYKGKKTIKQKLDEVKYDRLEDIKNILRTFIKEINRKGRYLDMLDAYRMADLYESYIGSNAQINMVNTERQLLIMWKEINKYVTSGIDNPYSKRIINDDETETHKRCRGCEELLLLSQFARARANTLRSLCRDCQNKYQKKLKNNLL